MSAMLHHVDDDTTRPGRPREPQSFAGRLREYFDASPDEELSYDDICTKFGISKNTAYNVVRQLEQQGLVEAVFVVRPRNQRRNAS